MKHVLRGPLTTQRNPAEPLKRTFKCYDHIYCKALYVILKWVIVKRDKFTLEIYFMLLFI